MNNQKFNTKYMRHTCLNASYVVNFLKCFSHTEITCIHKANQLTCL